MAPRDDAPQTVAEALRSNWKFLGVRCQLCRRKARICLAGRRADEKLSAIATRLRCTHCGDRSSVEFMSFALIAGWRWEKRISFSGYRAVKITVN